MAGRDTRSPQRAAFVRSGLAGYPGGTFAPFTAQEWTGLDYEGALACLRWPPAAFPDPPVPPSAPYPNVPTLILNGDLDNITPLADARVVASRFPRSTLVVMQNSGHVTALEDQNDCAAPIYEHFVRTLSAGDTSCAERTPEVRVVPSFPLGLSGVAPALPSAGDGSTAARPAGGGRERRRGCRRPAALVGEPERERRRPARRHLVVHRRRPDRLHAPQRRVRARGAGDGDGALALLDRARARRGGRPHGRRRRPSGCGWRGRCRCAPPRRGSTGTAGGRTLRLHMLAP